MKDACRAWPRPTRRGAPGGVAQPCTSTRGLAGGPAHLAATDNVQVQVVDRLAAIGAVVHHDTVSLRQPLLLRHLHVAVHSGEKGSHRLFQGEASRCSRPRGQSANHNWKSA